MSKRKHARVFPNYARVRDSDYKELSNLVKAAIGARSLAQFSSQSGVSTATLSRLLNCKFTAPCADSIIAAIAENADPCSGVTLEQFLYVHGLEKLENSYSLNSYNTGIIDLKKQLDVGSAMSQAERPNESISFIDGETSKTRVIREMIQNLLLQNGFSISLSPRRDIVSFPCFSYNVSFVIKTDAYIRRNITSWAIDIPEEQGISFKQKLMELFCAAYLGEILRRGIRLSLVTTSEDDFRQTIRDFGKSRFLDEISIILVDTEKQWIVDEFIFEKR